MRMFIVMEIIFWTMGPLSLHGHKIGIVSAMKFIQKNNACAFKTPHVVALPFIYGVECIIISKYRSVKFQHHWLPVSSSLVSSWLVSSSLSIHNQAKDIRETFFDLVTLTFDL